MNYMPFISTKKVYKWLKLILWNPRLNKQVADKNQDFLVKFLSLPKGLAFYEKTT